MPGHWVTPFVRLNRIVNLYIEFAELQALDRRPMTMRKWVEKLDEFLKISGRELLDHAGNVSAEAARAKAVPGLPIATLFNIFWTPRPFLGATNFRKSVRSSLPSERHLSSR